MKWTSVALTLTLLWLSDVCNGARILFLDPVATPSHKMAYMPVFEGLAERGHHLTIVSPFPPKKTIPNIREIVLKTYSEIRGVANFFTKSSLPKFVVNIRKFYGLRERMEESYHALMDDPEFRRILKEESFDLVMIDSIVNDFCLPIADHFKVPIITIGASEGPPWVLGNLGAPYNLASQPATVSTYGNRMTFWQRFENAFLVTVSRLSMEWIVLPHMNALVRKDFPNARSIQEVEKDISLCIISTHPSLNWPRPLPPSVINIRGLHVKPIEALPPNLQEFADGSGSEGFILFTLGSAIQSATIPEEKVQSLVKAFSKIPQRVIWKWEANEPPINLPSNVLTVKWLPQRDLLGHPKVRLFMTHGGLLGLQEAISHSIPLLGLPLVSDQFINMAKIEIEGAGLSLDWDTLEENIIHQSISTLTKDSSFRGNMTRLSRLLEEEPMPSKEKAVYWVEHILRHGGGRHLRVSSLDLPLYQHYLLDVVALLILIVSLASYFSVLITRYLLRRLMRRFTKEKLQ